VLVTAVLIVRRVPGAVLWGILLTGAGALALGLTEYDGILSTPPSLAPTLLKLNFTPSITSGFLSAVFVFLFMDMFDTVGTLIGVSERAGFLQDGKLPRAGRAMLADSGGTVIGAMLGTSTITSYIESTTGIEQGARTGLANVFTAGGFVLALFFYPLVQMIGGGVQVAEGLILKPVIAPALIVVGAFMTSMVRRISWDDFSESLPAFLIIVGIPLTFSISDGLAFGFVTYPLLKLLGGRGKSVHPAMYIIGGLFVIRYVFFPN
jgi:AGZA family xanthine/uracil permease-like MFS transporter